MALIAYPFDEPNVDRAPEQAGVYFLYDQGELIYIGCSGSGLLAGGTVKSRLKYHLRGSEGPCTAGASHFAYEIRPDAAEAEEGHLEEATQHLGRLPRCNDRK